MKKFAVLITTVATPTGVGHVAFGIKVAEGIASGMTYENIIGRAKIDSISRLTEVIVQSTEGKLLMLDLMANVKPQDVTIEKIMEMGRELNINIRTFIIEGDDIDIDNMITLPEETAKDKLNKVVSEAANKVKDPQMN